MVAGWPVDRLPSDTVKPALGHACQRHGPGAARRCRFLRVQPAGDELERHRSGQAPGRTSSQHRRTLDSSSLSAAAVAIALLCLSLLSARSRAATSSISGHSVVASATPSASTTIPTSIQVVGQQRRTASSTRSSGCHLVRWSISAPSAATATPGHQRARSDSRQQRGRRQAAVGRSMELLAAHGPSRTSAPRQARAAPMRMGSTTESAVIGRCCRRRWQRRRLGREPRRGVDHVRRRMGCADARHPAG